MEDFNDSWIIGINSIMSIICIISHRATFIIGIDLSDLLLALL